jgi:hypothetical protein
VKKKGSLYGFMDEVSEVKIKESGILKQDCSGLDYKKTNVDLNVIGVFNMVMEMQKKFASKFNDFDHMTLEDRVKWTKEYLIHLNCEGVELLEMIPFKHWKNYDGFKVDEVNLRYELVDMFHFFLDLCLVWGMTGEDLIRMYYAKNQHNFERQKNPKFGYVKKNGKKKSKVE